MSVPSVSIDQLFGLSGRVAIVTGASSGLGIEFAETLACAGASVALFARRADRLAAVEQDLRERYGVKTLAVAVDITDRAALADAFARVESSLGPVWVLVNNAGIAPTGRAEKQWPEQWDNTLAVNATATFQASLLAAAQMKRAGSGGRIINITSIFGSLGSSLFRVASYAASKGAAENLTRQLAVEWAADRITVNAIAPAWFPSEMTHESIVRESIEERMAAGNPMGRIGAAGELRTACLFLASPSSSYVTGAVVPVDGGYTAW
ncbi:MAG TPA: SDR family oxidoreductase [Candidatus Limnocylindrales bacterium]|nr:SDR family oxidoreductase [Candidatus Limnocylindrales bacterium]